MDAAGARRTRSHILRRVDSAIARAALLERLGMDVEARFEYDALEAAAARIPELLAATAHALLEHGQPSRTIRLAQKLIDGGQRDARAYRLLFPLLDRRRARRATRRRAASIPRSWPASFARSRTSMRARCRSPTRAG